MACMIDEITILVMESSREAGSRTYIGLSESFVSRLA